MHTRTRLRRGYTAHRLPLGFCCVPPLPSPRASGSPSRWHRHSHRIPSQFHSRISLLRRSTPNPVPRNTVPYRARKLGLKQAYVHVIRVWGFRLFLSRQERGDRNLFARLGYRGVAEKHLLWRRLEVVVWGVAGVLGDCVRVRVWRDREMAKNLVVGLGL